MHPFKSMFNNLCRTNSHNLIKTHGTCLEDGVQWCHGSVLYATGTGDQNPHKTDSDVHACFPLYCSRILWCVICFLIIV